LPECALPAEYHLGHNLDEHCLEDTGVVWSLSYPGARRRREGLKPLRRRFPAAATDAARHTVTTKTQGILLVFGPDPR